MVQTCRQLPVLQDASQFVITLHQLTLRLTSQNHLFPPPQRFRFSRRSDTECQAWRSKSLVTRFALAPPQSLILRRHAWILILCKKRVMSAGQTKGHGATSGRSHQPKTIRNKERNETRKPNHLSSDANDSVGLYNVESEQRAPVLLHGAGTIVTGLIEMLQQAQIFQPACIANQGPRYHCVIHPAAYLSVAQQRAPRRVGQVT